MIFVVSGAGGVGKGTLVDELVAQDPGLWLSRSWTTRPRRAGEPEDAYRFVSPEEFEFALESGAFLEAAEFLGHRYGTPVPNPPEGADVVLEIDVQGASQVLDAHPDAVVIWLEAPSKSVQAARLRARGESKDQVAKRVELGAREDEEGRKLADQVVVNDDLSRAVGEVRDIIEARRGAGS